MSVQGKGVAGDERRFSDMTVYVGDLAIDETVITATPAELNILDGVTATAAEINAAADGISTADAVTATADGLTTGLIPTSVRVAIITSADATHIATLPGIAANSLPIGYMVFGRVAATGCEIRTPATSNETINGVDADASEAALAANRAFVAVVESATGWLLLDGAATVPD